MSDWIYLHAPARCWHAHVWECGLFSQVEDCWDWCQLPVGHDGKHEFTPTPRMRRLRARLDTWRLRR